MIPTVTPWIDDEELVQLKRVISSTYVTEGPLTSEFELMICELTGSKFAISYANGTLALYASLKVLGIGPGDEVIVPDLTFVATANAVILTGATPIFCDVLCNNFGINPIKIQALITENTKAVIPVHLYGRSCNISEIKNICKKNNLFLVEDAAQGVGVYGDDKSHAGTYGDIGVLSFYGNKTITCGEGGICLTNSKELATSLYKLKNHGREIKGIFTHDDIGYNFSFTDLQAAIGIAQLKKLDRIKEKRFQIYEWYKSELGESLVAFSEEDGNLPWLINLKLNNPQGLELKLKKNLIQTRRFFTPLHMQPCYDKKYFLENNFDTTVCIYNSHLSLPSSHALTKEEVHEISRIILSDDFGVGLKSCVNISQQCQK